MSHPFDASMRLKQKAEFDYVFQAKKRISSKNFLVYYRLSLHATEAPRIGVVVSRKKARRAVVRNRIRRIVKESFRLGRDQLPPFDFIVIPKDGILTATAQEWRQCIDQLWARLAKR